MKRGWLAICLSLLLHSPVVAQQLGSRLTVLPEDGRGLYFRAIDAARSEIRIEICVLEDPEILAHVEAALRRGVAVRAIVDFGKYQSLVSEQENLARYLVGPGGRLHLSNPIFPRSFPKIVLVDSRLLVYGSACLDETTFLHYRDFATSSTDPEILAEVQRLFENDWRYSEGVGDEAPPFNPTPPVSLRELVVSPVNGAERLVRLYQSAAHTLDVYTELLGNPTLESELAGAARHGVEVRLIAPLRVNGGTARNQQLQYASLVALAAAGVGVHVSGPAETTEFPYMHARAAVADGNIGYLGSISLSPDSITFNREFGLILRQPSLVDAIAARFRWDWRRRTRRF